MMKRFNQILLLLLFCAFVASGCAARKPVESLIKITGVAPQTGSCEIQLVQMSGDAALSWKRPVNGPFEEYFVLPVSDYEYVVEGGCGMIISVMKTAILPAEAPLALGKIRP